MKGQLNRAQSFMWASVFPILIVFTGSTSGAKGVRDFETSKCATKEVLRYNRMLQNIKKDRIMIKSLKPVVQIQKASQLLLVNLVDSVFPAWDGTKWDFNGITNVPRQGVIACGYFVSTTLKHVGFNLNRYKMAQQAASVIIKETCGKKQVSRFHDMDTLLITLRAKPNGLYIVGLDYHVGFLLVEDERVYFIHSDFFNGKVVRELAKNSVAFSSSTVYVLGQLTGNTNLIKKWLNGSRIYG